MKYLYQVVFEDEYLNLIEVGWYENLDDAIERELGNNYTLLIDTEHKPVDSFIEQLKIISDYDAILLEDDVILCKDFVNEITKVVKKYKKYIINFFTLPHEYFTTTLGLFQFVYNQCTYYL